MLYIAALAVVSLYFDMPKVHAEKSNTSFILLMIKGSKRQVSWLSLHE